MTKRLWAPWRMAFLEKVTTKNKECIFCSLPRRGANAKNLILYQGKQCFVIMNRYPYTNGHLMVVPRKHTSDYSSLTAQEHVEMAALISQSLKILKKKFKAQGFNVGLNLGKAAGAGIESHIHHHIVPRWVGDVNFLPIMSDVRMMHEYLDATYQKLKGEFDKIKL